MNKAYPVLIKKLANELGLTKHQQKSILNIWRKRDRSGKYKTLCQIELCGSGEDVEAKINVFSIVCCILPATFFFLFFIFNNPYLVMFLYAPIVGVFLKRAFHDFYSLKKNEKNISLSYAMFILKPEMVFFLTRNYISISMIFLYISLSYAVLVFLSLKCGSYFLATLYPFMGIVHLLMRLLSMSMLKNFIKRYC